MNNQVRPDILLIVLDTLRADRLSCYGYERDTCPHLDAFAEQGVLYERAVSPAQWTIPSHASFFTGEYPTTHGVTQIYNQQSKEQVTLADILHSEGYLTVGFCNNPLLGVVDNGLDRGFEEFYNYGGAFPSRPAIGESRPRLWGRTYPLARVRGLYASLCPITGTIARRETLCRAINGSTMRGWFRCGSR